MNFDRRDERPKSWKDIWGAGQGVGNIGEVMPAREVVARLRAEYRAARRELARGDDADNAQEAGHARTA
jgi:nitronate monooxygenase